MKLCFLLLLIPCAAFALTAEEPLADPAQEMRARALFHEFRCVVCQSESVADSPAEVAGDIRRAVRQFVQDGKTDEEIKALLVARYGEFILMAPPFSTATFLLWLGPLLFLLAGGMIVLRHFRKPGV